MTVLDAWPVMEWLKRKEPVAARFSERLIRVQAGHNQLCMSRINLGEVLYLAAKQFGMRSALELVNQIRSIGIEVVSVADGDVDAAALLKSRYPISYADAFAAHLSIVRDAPLLTGDSEFKKLEADGFLTLDWIGA